MKNPVIDLSDLRLDRALFFWYVLYFFSHIGIG